MDELGSDDPVIQQQYDMEIGLSDSAEGEEMSDGIDDNTTPQGQENRTPLSDLSDLQTLCTDVTNKSSRSKEGGPPTQSRPKRQRQTRDIKHPRRHQAAGTRRQSICKRSRPKVRAEASSGKAATTRILPKIIRQANNAFREFLGGHGTHSIGRTITTNTSAPPTDATFNKWASIPPYFGGYEGALLSTP
eukprot:jgi/Botrbrau1/4889/Bobra.118_1s0003.1